MKPGSPQHATPPGVGDNRGVSLTRYLTRQEAPASQNQPGPC